MGMMSIASRSAARWTVWGRLLIAGEVALTMKRHLDRLEGEEKTELRRIVAKSKGRPSNLSPTERGRLRDLVSKLEPADLAKNAARSVATGRRSR